MILIGFRAFSDKFEFYVRNHSHKQSSILDTISNYMFYFGPAGTYLHLSPQTHYPLLSGRGIVVFLYFVKDVFLEIPSGVRAPERP